MRHNRKFLFGLLVLAFLLGCTQTPEQRAKDATVLIIAANAEGYIGSGSGFFVEPDKIATNIHVVAGAKIVFAVGTKRVYNIGKVAGYAPEHDLVVLKVLGKGKPLELGEGKIGESIFAVGYPGRAYKVTKGALHGIRKSDKQLRLVARDFPKNRDSVLVPGNSGGPVLNSEGKVIGIAVGGPISGGEGFVSAIAASMLNTLLDSSNEENLSDWQKRNSVLAYVYEAWGVKKLKSENDEEAVKGFDKALTSYKYAGVYEKLGSVKHGLGRYQEAIQNFDKAIELIPDNFITYYNRGFAQLKSGNHIGAIQDCDKVLELNPDSVEVYLVQGPAKKAKLDYVGAIADYTKAINNLNPKEPWNYYHYRGDAKLQSRDYAGAIADYTEAIRLKDDFVNAYLNRGVAKAEKPDPDYAGAIEDYNKIILDLDPKDGRAYNNRGNAKKALGQDKDAELDYAKAYYYWGKTDSNNYQSVIDNFDKAIALDPNYAETYHYRGDAYRLRGQKADYQKAIADYDEVVKLKPDYAEIQVIYNNRGLAKVGINNYDEAINDYTEAIRLRRNYADAYYNRGEAYWLRGLKDGVQRGVGNENFQKADKDYTEAIELKNDFANAYHKRGLVKEALGQDDAAKVDFVSAYYLWGDEVHRAKQYQEAIKNYDAVLELEPDFAFVYSYRGSAKGALGKSKADLGDSEGALKEYQVAIEDFNKAIELQPKEAQYYRHRGGTRCWRAVIRDRNGTMEDYESAIEDFEEAIKRNSNLGVAYSLSGKARCLLGYAKANQGNTKKAREQYKKALKDFKEAIKLDKKNAGDYKGLGLANAALGKAKAAIDAFEKVKQLEEAKSEN